MARGGTARRTNRLHVLIGVVILVVSGAAAAFGDRDGTSSPASTTTTTQPERPQVDGTGTRPAETARSWFDHGTAREQFDYAMERLSCAEMARYLSLDLCAVATSRSGSFMLVGTESFWDPTETDSDGTSWVPFDLTAFTMRRDGGSRAMSVLDGYTEKAYTRLKVQLDLYRAEVDGDEVLVLVKRMADGAGATYDYMESVQVLAASPTGAPTLVASYEGADVEVAGTGDALTITSRRYGPPGEDGSESRWFTSIRLAPGNREAFSWDETVTSGPIEGTRDTGVTLVDSYTFPVSRGEGSDQNTDA